MGSCHSKDKNLTNSTLATSNKNRVNYNDADGASIATHKIDPQKIHPEMASDISQQEARELFNRFSSYLTNKKDGGKSYKFVQAASFMDVANLQRIFECIIYNIDKKTSDDDKQSVLLFVKKVSNILNYLMHNSENPQKYQECISRTWVIDDGIELLEETKSTVCICYVFSIATIMF